jgi:uncharacterized membrane protein YphA (DoxX/SURF4 family)
VASVLTSRLVRPAHLFFAAVWLINGVWCKLLGGAPRHEAIVARVLGEAHAPLLTRLIGGAEIVMAFWILSGLARRLGAAAQITTVLTMNLIEFTLAPDLLLFGRYNLLVALAYCALVAAVDLRRPPAPITGGSAP